MLNAITEVMSRFAAVHYLIIAVNLLLMLLARSLILKTGGKLTERQIDFRVNVLRVLNLAILMAVCYNAFYSGGDSGRGFAVRLISILVVLYLELDEDEIEAAEQVGDYLIPHANPTGPPSFNSKIPPGRIYKRTEVTEFSE